MIISADLAFVHAAQSSMPPMRGILMSESRTSTVFFKQRGFAVRSQLAFSKPGYEFFARRGAARFV